MFEQDTIAAIATPAGEGAISVIRVSGEDTFRICDKIFKSPSGKKISEQKGYTIHYGEIIDNGEVIDEVLVSVFRKPHSYTGEDSVEISCHGSVYIQQKILQVLIKAGARTAQPGEFTKRAFLNGKMDLSQAEAVADLIASKSEAERRVALNQLKGGVSNELTSLRKQLVDFVSLIELELDFSEEDVEFADRNELLKLILTIKQRIDKLLTSFSFGNAIKNGVPVAIVGRPNAGKSTLLNTLLKEDKAIVSEIEGTTRDSIEDIISINGILFRFIDTAGLRQTSDKIENLGIEKAIEHVKKAEIILYLIDASQDAKPVLFDKILPFIENKKLIILLNKVDKSIISKENLNFGDAEIFEISAKYGKNIDKLEKTLLEAVNFSTFAQNDIIITRTRHYEALKRCSEAADNVVEGLRTNLPSDLLTIDIRQMLHFLGEITGEITTDEILGNIFNNFCIGK